MNAGELAALRRFAAPPARAAERCDLCGVEIAARHDHLVEPGRGKLLCACLACAPRFDGAGPDATLVRVPPRAVALALTIEDAEWRGLGIPVAMAFFRQTRDGRIVAVFPGPAGAIESELDPAAWRGLAAHVPALASDVEALLVSRLQRAPGCYLVSIDVCYRLVGVLRARWTGFAGGEEAWSAVADFFHQLAEDCRRG